ncbi:MAG: DUF5915 domain-containing protein [Chloroflexota bacterium]
MSFKNVICLGLILDGEGKKMSKSRGNVVEPWDVLNVYGADMFRWYMYTAGPPGEPRRFSVDLVGQAYRAFWLTLWNTYRFFVEYANLDGFDPSAVDLPVERRSPLDRWVLAELQALVRDVTEAFEGYDATNATRPIERFVIDRLSNWYVRLSRPRFWKSEDDEDKAAAHLTLYECLVTVGKLLAPTMPFFAEELYRNLVGSVDGSAESVHLSTWPEVDEALLDEDLIGEMGLVMRLVGLGRAARNSADIKMRQPLAEAAFSLPASERAVVEKYADLIAAELNVKEVVVLDQAEEVIRYTLNPLPDLLGPRFKGDFPALRKLLVEDESGGYARTLLGGEPIEVTFKGEAVALTPEEVEVRSSPVEGYAAAQDAAYLAAVKIALSDELIAEGLAREFIRRVQTLRKEADFNIDDRIVTAYAASERLAKAVEQFAGLIKGETLSDVLVASDDQKGERSESYEFDGETLRLAISRE